MKTLPLDEFLRPAHFRLRKAAVIVACVAAAAFAPCAPAQPPLPAPAIGAASAPMQGAQLLKALRGGGYVLYFRHTSTDFGESDERMTSFEDCAKQRNLTEQGRAEARAIGAAIREFGIPIAEVLASPYCRTMETARLAFGRATATPAVRGGPALPDSPDRYAELKQLLSLPVAAGGNVVIASHGNPYRAAVGGSYLAEGEAAVIAPLGRDGFRVVARIGKNEWVELRER